MSDVAVRARGVTKTYGRITAVEDLDLEIGAAEVFGLLGPNGSGKTTTILMMLGLTEPDHGEISVLGLDPKRRPLSVKRQVGYLPDAVGFYDELTGRENLRYTAQLNGMPVTETETRIGEILDRMGLAAAGGQPVGTYSRGMRQRLGLADLLLKRPRIAIMDEPTLGLDPRAADEFLELIGQLRQDGVTVILSSHLLHQVQFVCDRVGLFAAGRMRLVGSFEELSRDVVGGRWRIEARLESATHARRFAGEAAAVAGVSDVEHDEVGVTVFANRDIRRELLAMANAGGMALLDLHHRPIGLDEIYAAYYARTQDGG